MCFQQKKLSKSVGYIYLRIEVTLIFLSSDKSYPGSFRSFSISWYGTNQQANGKMYKITQGCKFEWRKYLDLSPEKNKIIIFENWYWLLTQATKERIGALHMIPILILVFFQLIEHHNFGGHYDHFTFASSISWKLSKIYTWS